MKRFLMGLCFMLISSISLAGTFRVGSQVLTVGDSATHVVSILGDPVFKFPIENEYGAYIGERWQYAINGHTVTFFLINGEVADIQDRID